jgi:hypothetical protein
MNEERALHDDTHPAHQRYIMIRHTIPDRLDQIADQIVQCHDLISMCGLTEALQPDPAAYRVLASGLRDAAGRIRVAAQHIPLTDRRTGEHLEPDPGLAYGGMP